MSIPLVQKAEKDDINTSIIAIKRNIERINMLLGLVDSGGSDPDLSGLATKQELQDAVESLQPVDEVTVDNMQSVTSNAVAKALSYSTTEQIVGYWIDGKPIYKITQDLGAYNGGWWYPNHNIANIDTIICYFGMGYKNDGASKMLPNYDSFLQMSKANYAIVDDNNTFSKIIVTAFYTKTTD